MTPTNSSAQTSKSSNACSEAIRIAEGALANAKAAELVATKANEKRDDAINLLNTATGQRDSARTERDTLAGRLMATSDERNRINDERNRINESLARAISESADLRAQRKIDRLVWISIGGVGTALIGVVAILVIK